VASQASQRAVGRHTSSMAAQHGPASQQAIAIRFVFLVLFVVTFFIHNQEIHIAPLLLPSVLFFLVLIVVYYAWFVRRAR